MIEFVYVFCGLVLPAFYIPQILKLTRDNSRLAGFSLGKAVSQLILRVPALVFAVFVVKHPLMNLVVGLDVIGRSIELGVALFSLKRQGMCWRAMAYDWLSKFHPQELGWKRLAYLFIGSGGVAAFVAHAIDHA